MGAAKQFERKNKAGVLLRHRLRTSKDEHPNLGFCGGSTRVPAMRNQTALAGTRRTLDSMVRPTAAAYRAQVNPREPGILHPPAANVENWRSTLAE